MSAPPETYRAWKPCCDANRAISPLKHPGTMMQSLARIFLNYRHLAIRFIIKIILAKKQQLYAMLVWV